LPEVICNTSPLQYLYQADLLYILPALIKQLTVPSAVVQELAIGRKLGIKLPDIQSLEWIIVKRPSNESALPLINDLGAGEAQVLLLALELPGAVVILDDALARRAASMRKIPLTGTLGLLLDAKRAGLISEIRPVLDHLQSLRFRLAPHTRAAVLKLAGESSL